MDTIYGQMIFTATALCGGYLVLVKRDRYHTIMWLSLCFMLIALGIAQEVMRDNSVPLFSGLFAMIAGYSALHIASKTRTYWPLWIAAFMAVTMFLDALFLVLSLTGVEHGRASIFAYQSVGNIMHYFSLIALCAHPRIRRNAKSPDWVYS